MSARGTVKVAAVQMQIAEECGVNVERAEKFVREAAARGAQIICLPELFEGHYFCKDHRAEDLARARPIEGHPTVELFKRVAAELAVVIVVSVYELATVVRFNTVVVIDADGSALGIYRKSHIPDGPGYSEKFYFSPGDTGFRVWNTRYARLGVGICWDQWFPEAARAMALQGADVLFYPTAIGSEPQDPTYDSSMHWQRVMQGHSGANLVPVVAANRIGREVGKPTEITFYGCSFITDATGAKIHEAGRTEEVVLVGEVDTEKNSQLRASWGVFRDRRPDLYSIVGTLAGPTK